MLISADGYSPWPPTTRRRSLLLGIYLKCSLYILIYVVPPSIIIKHLVSSVEACSPALAICLHIFHLLFLPCFHRSVARPDLVIYPLPSDDWPHGVLKPTYIPSPPTIYPLLSLASSCCHFTSSFFFDCMFYYIKPCLGTVIYWNNMNMPAL
jgi:hypothetical protein